MAMYTIDKQAAIESDNLGGYITESGKYIGKFTRAERLVSPRSGADGVGFTFESQGRTCRFSLWIQNKTGSEQYHGWKQLNGIMTCLGIRQLSTIQGQVERFNFETRKNEKIAAEIFPDLLEKPIGLVLQKKEYKKMKDGYETGETAWQPEMLIAFRATDEFTASEIMLQAKEPRRLPAVLATLVDKALPDRARPATAHASAPATPAASSGFDNDIDGDIPF